MNVTDVQKALYDWVVAETGIPVIWERANAPRPPNPYIGLLVLALVPFGLAHTGRPNGSGIATIVGQSVLSLSINSYIDRQASSLVAVNDLEELRLSLWKESTSDIFRNKGIGYLASTNSQNLDQVLGTEFEQRAVLDVNFLIASSITDDVGIIERVEGVGEYYDSTGQLKHSVDFTAEV
jgi:hypothetical protein